MTVTFVSNTRPPHQQTHRTIESKQHEPVSTDSGHLSGLVPAAVRLRVRLVQVDVERQVASALSSHRDPEAVASFLVGGGQVPRGPKVPPPNRKLGVFGPLFQKAQIIEKKKEKKVFGSVLKVPRQA